jgi:hypothetical protein
MRDQLDATDQPRRPEQLRRAVPRQPADWFGFFRFDDSDTDAWRCCRVIDISRLGAGLELFGTSGDEDMTGPITVSLELRGGPRGLTMNPDENSARVGIEFTTPSEAAKIYMRSLSGVRSRW